MKKRIGYAVISGNKVMQILIKDPRRDEIGKTLVQISRTVARARGEKFEVKKFDFRV